MERDREGKLMSEVTDEILKDIVPIKKKKNEFVINQSLIKKLIDKHGNTLNYCPLRIYMIYIKKEYRELITESMMWGAYFENLVLGEKNLIMLPTNKKTGDKLKDQIRIELQAERFSDLMISKGVDVVPGGNTYIPIVKRWDDGIICSGELDIFPATYGYTDEITGKTTFAPIIGDVKLTGDVKNTFGTYCWGTPQFMDHLQGDMYLWLIEDFDIKLNKQFNPEREQWYDNIFSKSIFKNLIEQKAYRFFYFVFGYKKDNITEQFKAVERQRDDNPNNPTGNRRKEFAQRINAAIGELAISKANKWNVNPSFENCSDCPVSKENGGECTKYVKFIQV